MKLIKTSLLFSTIVIGWASAPSSADTLYTNTAATSVGSVGDNRNDFTGYVGLQFTVGASPLTVTSLGIYDAFNNASASGSSGTNHVDNTSPGDGLGTSHIVVLYGTSTSDLIARATVPAASTATAAANDFIYSSSLFAADGTTALSAVTLTANTTYTLLTGFTSGGGNDGFLDVGSGVTTTSTSISSYKSAYVQGGGSSTLPGTSDGIVVPSNSQIYIGPNLLFSVPEPSSLCLLGLGVLGLAHRRRRA